MTQQVYAGGQELQPDLSPLTRQADFEDVRTYHLHLISRGLQAQAVNQIACALRFLYAVTLGKPEAKTQIPLAKRADILPAVLSPEEVAQFLNAVAEVKYRATALAV